LPRMADFALWATAAEAKLDLPLYGSGQDEALASERWNFIEAYTGNRTEVNTLALEVSPAAQKLQEFMREQTEWKGTATELLAELKSLVDEADRKQSWWPKQPHVLSGQLRRAAPNLRRCGIDINFDHREGHEGKRVLLIRKMGAVVRQQRQ